MVALSNSKSSVQICAICNTKNGEERPIGKVIVNLKEVDIEGSKIVLCQVCHKNKINMLTQKNRKKKSSGNFWIEKLKKLGFF